MKNQTSFIVYEAVRQWLAEYPCPFGIEASDYADSILDHFDEDCIDLSYTASSTYYIKEVLSAVSRNTTLANIDHFDWYAKITSEECRKYIWAGDKVGQIDSAQSGGEEWYDELRCEILSECPEWRDWVKYDLEVAMEWADDKVFFKSSTHRIADIFSEAHNLFTERWMLLVLAGLKDEYQLYCDDGPDEVTAQAYVVFNK